MSISLTGLASDFVEFAVETMTGSEALGDIAGAHVAFAGGDYIKAAEQVVDLAQNVVEGAKSFSNGPGGSNAPSSTSQSSAWEEVSWSPLKELEDEIKKLIAQFKSGGMNFETFIIALLAKMIDDQKEKVTDKAESMDDERLENKKNKDGSDYTNADGDTEQSGVISQESTAEFQSMMSTLTQLQNLLTNIQKSFHDAKMATIQNTR